MRGGPSTYPRRGPPTAPIGVAERVLEVPVRRARGCKELTSPREAGRDGTTGMVDVLARQIARHSVTPPTERVRRTSDCVGFREPPQRVRTDIGPD